jgi:predicted dehydrogenase
MRTPAGLHSIHRVVATVDLSSHRWGIAGPGAVAARFAKAMELVEDGQITAVASRSKERAQEFARRLRIPVAYGDYRALAEDPAVDIVYVATPASRHMADTLLYVRASKHVLCEKPFSLNASQAQVMAAAALERDVFLMEAMWSRFLPGYRAIQDALSEAHIGEPLLVEADFGFRTSVADGRRLFGLFALKWGGPVIAWGDV